MTSKIYGVFESNTSEIAVSDIEQMEVSEISFIIAVARKTLIVMCNLYLLIFLTRTFIQKFHLHLHILGN
ncbi:hypothetical protein MWJ95_16400 [Lysinibacillus sp. Bpr_S20]|nr:hypothetical protein [Lysinibacillus sp. Bpr_S20]MCL1701994.1 hypothetical protein [Lysinibacillus sp. Bpr_S20]